MSEMMSDRSPEVGDRHRYDTSREKGVGVGKRGSIVNNEGDGFLTGLRGQVKKL
jgi:hypothetical protein